VELARRGFAFSTALWSGEAILTRPDLLLDIHRAYLAAGAHVIETATYQLSHATLRELGYSEAGIDRVFARAVQLARDAVAVHIAHAERDASQRYLVAGSLGPYGATLGDGSEYSGAQAVERDELYAFHAERTRSMMRAAPDAYLFETIPSRAEGRLIAQVARDLGLNTVWLSFSCVDGAHTYAGDIVGAIAAELDAFACIDVVGVNCTGPQHIAPLVRAIRSATAKPIFACANLGQHWEAGASGLAGGLTETDFVRCVPEWLDLGVAYLGGCCGVGPAAIAALAHIAAEQGG
jgi:homocysteine S-methyltransferase